MCHEYKFACINWSVCGYPASMMNIIWFADEKFLKFCSCGCQKNVQSDHIHMSVGIV